ncbi:MAG: hypothetical protein MZW92_33375 [Comamonadaceae bacterium]|nr:hypothetical protein [Comamonadaceae bacterium]
MPLVVIGACRSSGVPRGVQFDVEAQASASATGAGRTATSASARGDDAAAWPGRDRARRRAAARRGPTPGWPAGVPAGLYSSQLSTARPSFRVRVFI